MDTMDTSGAGNEGADGIIEGQANLLETMEMGVASIEAMEGLEGTQEYLNMLNAGSLDLSGDIMGTGLGDPSQPQ